MVRIHDAVYPRFPSEGSSATGKSVPKQSPAIAGVCDGQLVNIPVLVLNRQNVRCT
jgi:hypothetical protein